MATNGAAPATTAGRSNGAAAHTSGAAPATTTNGAVIWVRVAALARDLDRDPRRVREWIDRNVPKDDRKRRSRQAGGSPELCITPAAAETVRRHFAAAPAPPAATEATAAPAPPPQDRPAAADPDGWREALALATAEADRLRSQLGSKDVALQEALHRAEEAERARHAAAEQLEALRGAWWRWYAVATTRGVWARLRGRLPEPPAEMTSDRLLTVKG